MVISSGGLHTHLGMEEKAKAPIKQHKNINAPNKRLEMKKKR